jgi:hypothetical protein
MFDLTTEETSTLRIPDFRDAEFEDVKVEPFVGNLTFMMNDFCAYKIWAPMFKESSRLASTAEEFECNGGEFVISPYNICIDFWTCDGIIKIIWRSNLDHHKTFISSTKTGFTCLSSLA